MLPFLYCVLSNDDCITGEVRLVGGVVNSSSGLLEVCVDGVWGSVCDYHNEWTLNNAAVVYRQLSLPTSSMFQFITSLSTFTILCIDASLLPFSVYNDAIPNSPVLLDSVQCTGNEEVILNCSHASTGNHFCSRLPQDIMPIVAIQYINCSYIHVYYKF